MNEMTARAKKDEVIIALTNRKGRIDTEDLFADAAQDFKEDLEPENSLDYFRAIEYAIGEYQNEHGLYISKEDKDNLLQDMLYFKIQIQKFMKEFKKIQTFEGD